MVQENQKALSSQEQLKNERYLWIARAFSVMAVLSILANIFLLVAIGSLVPLVRVRPYFMTVLDKNQQVVEITPPRADQLNNQEICVIGDQLFTDIYGGNRLNIFTVLVKQVHERDIWITKFKRPLEKRIMTSYHKNNEKMAQKRDSWKKKSAISKKIQEKN